MNELASKKSSISLSRVRRRMETDFRFAIIMTFGNLVLFSIGGFTVYRLVTGDIAHALMNFVIMSMVAGVILLTVLSGQSRTSGLVFALITTSSVIFISFILAGNTSHWSFLVLWVNFLLATRKVALLLNLSIIAFLVVSNNVFDQFLDAMTYTITAVLVTAFGYVSAWRLAMQREQLQTIALRDHLTQTGNRRMLRRDLANAQAEHERTGREFSIMLLDIDYFKAINDEFGHETGDRTLRDFANLISENIRASDDLYRYGGEEFVVLFRDVGPVGLEKVCTQLHHSTSKKLTSPGSAVAYSAGAAALQAKESVNEWLTRADWALYRAKAAGRNRVVISDQAVAEPLQVEGL